MTYTSPIRDTRDELNLAAETLLTEGALRLLCSDLSGLELFAQAEIAAPGLAYQQGLSCFEYGCGEKDERILLFACRKFKAATQLDPEHEEAWQAWGSCLLALGKLTEENHYFKAAQEKFSRVLGSDDGEFYWEIATVWSHLADLSGEAMELELALQAFEKASLLQKELPARFWADYAEAHMKLIPLVSDLEIVTRAVDLYRIALSKETSAKAWHNLAKSLETLYSFTHDEDHLLEAGEAYGAATTLRPDDSEIWSEWARLLTDVGCKQRDLNLLKSALEKCAIAHAYDPENPLVLGTWAEALAFTSLLTDTIEGIFEAQNKLLEAEEFEEESPEFWFSAGMVSLASGEYFEDIDDFYQAIENFQAGLSLDRTSARLWHAIGVAYTIVGTIEGVADDFEKAQKFFLRSLDLAPSTTTLFDYAASLSHFGEITQNQERLELAREQLERAISLQKNAFSVHPDWIFQYAATLDMLGDFYDEEAYYLKAIELYSHVMLIDPDFPHLHHRVGLAFAHLGSLVDEKSYIDRALHHFGLALSKDGKENPELATDWGLTLMALVEQELETETIEEIYAKAEEKFLQSAKFGYSAAYYHLACLYSLIGHHEKAMCFLEKSDRFAALPPLEDLLEDEWLEDVRSTHDFRSFVMRLESRTK